MKITSKLAQIKVELLGVKAVNSNWENVELISIHIPKTAGTSFYHSLKQEYGSQKVVRIDLASRPKINLRPMDQAYIYKNPKVIHGHFKHQQILEFTKINHPAPVITWLRDPVERVISNYYYLSKRLHQELEEEKKGLNILAKLEKSLMEYAQLELSQNRMSKFLKGIAPEDFFFVGKVENYNEDIGKLAKQLSWKNLSIVSYNQTGEKNKKKVDPQIRKEIEALNKADMDLYFTKFS